MSSRTRNLQPSGRFLKLTLTVGNILLESVGEVEVLGQLIVKIMVWPSPGECYDMITLVWSVTNNVT